MELAPRIDVLNVYAFSTQSSRQPTLSLPSSDVVFFVVVDFSLPREIIIPIHHFAFAQSASLCAIGAACRSRWLFICDSKDVWIDIRGHILHYKHTHTHTHIRKKTKNKTKNQTKIANKYFAWTITVKLNSLGYNFEVLKVGKTMPLSFFSFLTRFLFPVYFPLLSPVFFSSSFGEFHYSVYIAVVERIFFLAYSKVINDRRIRNVCKYYRAYSLRNPLKIWMES